MEIVPDSDDGVDADTSARAIRQRLGVRAASPAEVEAFFAEHAGRMVPPDGEG